MKAVPFRKESTIGMFDVLNVTLNNFRSYYGRHVVDLPRNPGLYSLTGQNIDSPRLDTNDCGKSTFLEAIHWALFGRTSRGCKAGEIVSWGEKSCSVLLTLIVNDKQLLIERRQAPNSLTLNGENVTQESLEKHLRIGPDQYVQAIMMPQFGHSFFDLSSTEKLNLFSDILGLNYWLERSEEATKLARELTHQKAIDSQAIFKLSGRIDQMRSDKATIETYLSEYEHVFVCTNVKRRETIQKLKAQLCKDKLELLEVQELIDAALDAAEICSKCKRPLPSNEGVHASRKARITRVINQSENELATLERELSKPPDNPYPRMLVSREKEITKAEQKQISIQAELAVTEENLAGAEFWASAFKRVRLFVAESAIKDLELEINGNLSGLGLTDWHIRLEVERETKSGGVTKGFTVLIHAPNRADPVRWEAFGGGATQRLRLAGNLGLANLIMERAGLTSKVEFYDEVTRGMGASGITDMLETLHARAMDTGGRIFVVDHHALEFGGFAGVLKAVKTEKGSRLEWKKR